MRKHYLHYDPTHNLDETDKFLNEKLLKPNRVEIDNIKSLLSDNLPMKTSPKLQTQTTSLVNLTKYLRKR